MENTKKMLVLLILVLFVMFNATGCGFLFLPLGTATEVDVVSTPAVTEPSEMEPAKTEPAKTEPAEETEPAIPEDQAYMQSCISPVYEDVARNPHDYEGKDVHFKGQIVQIADGFLSGDIYRIQVTPGDYGLWTDTVYVTYTLPAGESKFLENDIVDFYGECKGEYTYTTVLGSTNTIPRVDAKYMLLAEETVKANQFSEETVLSQLEITEYHYHSRWSHYGILAIKNNSEYDLDISAECKFYGDNEILIGADDGSISPLAPGSEYLISFYSEEAFQSFSYTLSARQAQWQKSVVTNLEYESTPAKKKEIVSVTNKADVSAKSVQMEALFFADGEIVDMDTTYFTDDDFEIKPGKTITKELSSDEEYDVVQFYLIGYR